MALRLARRLDRPRLGGQVVDAAAHRNAGLAVNRGVVDLRVEADPAIGETLDHVELPERPAAVEQARMEPRGERLELGERARLRQHQIADVVVDVDVVVVNPDRIREVERHQRELAREDRREVHALRDVVLDRLVPVAAVVGRRLEQVQAADVHRHLGAFQVQERRHRPRSDASSCSSFSPVVATASARRMRSIRLRSAASGQAR
jgi:hypothetical protein